MKYDVFDRPEFLIEANKQSVKHNTLVVDALIFVLVFLIGSVAQGLLMIGPTMGWLMTGERMEFILDTASKMMANGNYAPDLQALTELLENLPDWMIAAMLLCTAATGATAALYCSKLEKRRLRTLGFVKKGAAAEYGLGALLGIVLFAATYGISAAFGGVRIVGVSFTVQQLPVLGLLLLAFLVQGASEEILCRGYFMTTLSAKYSLPVCIGVSSIVFGLLHLGNVGASTLAVVNVVLFGIFLGIYLLKRGSIWGACAIHGLWNFTQGNVFGLPVSGTYAGSSVLASELQDANVLLTGGAFGLEGSLAMTIVLVAAIGAVCAFRGRNLLEKTPGE